MSNTKYIDLSTKIRAMKGKMLKDEDYHNLMMKNSVKEVALYLKDHTYYESALSELDENDVHRGRLEVLLYRAVVRDALKIAKHLSGEEKRIYRYIYRKLEIEDVKKMLRYLHMGKSLDQVDRQTLFISRYSRIDFNKSLLAQNIPELVDSFKGTKFYSVLKPLITREGTMDVFFAEMVLDLYYFQKTTKQVKKMDPGIDKEMLGVLLGHEADIANIYWIYRTKRFYDLNRELTIRYMVPYSYKLNKAQLKEMVEARNVEEVVEIVNQSFYGKIMDLHSGQSELQYLKYMHHVQSKNMRQKPFSIAPIIGYMYLKEQEVRNITNIVEGIRYSRDPEIIQQYLAGVK
jgi:V/A-type H+-transporting ATPase subunit C